MLQVPRGRQGIFGERAFGACPEQIRAESAEKQNLGAKNGKKKAAAWAVSSSADSRNRRYCPSYYQRSLIEECENHRINI